MDSASFDKLMRIFGASQVVWERMQTVEACGPEWKRLRRKHDLLVERYRIAREMSEPRTIN